MENKPVFEGDPQEIDYHLEEQFQLREKLEEINANLDGYERVIGLDKGSKIGFGGEVDFEEYWLRETEEKHRIEAQIRTNIRNIIGLPD